MRKRRKNDVRSAQLDQPYKFRYGVPYTRTAKVNQLDVRRQAIAVDRVAPIDNREYRRYPVPVEIPEQGDHDALSAATT
jgi:hypothetical protein